MPRTASPTCPPQPISSVSAQCNSSGKPAHSNPCLLSSASAVNSRSIELFSSTWGRCTFKWCSRCRCNLGGHLHQINAAASMHQHQISASDQCIRSVQQLGAAAQVTTCFPHGRLLTLHCRTQRRAQPALPPTPHPPRVSGTTPLGGCLHTKGLSCITTGRYSPLACVRPVFPAHSTRYVRSALSNRGKASIDAAPPMVSERTLGQMIKFD